MLTCHTHTRTHRRTDNEVSAYINSGLQLLVSIKQQEYKLTLKGIQFCKCCYFKSRLEFFSDVYQSNYGPPGAAARILFKLFFMSTFFKKMFYILTFLWSEYNTFIAYRSSLILPDGTLNNASLLRPAAAIWGPFRHSIVYSMYLVVLRRSRTSCCQEAALCHSVARPIGGNLKYHNQMEEKLVMTVSQFSGVVWHQLMVLQRYLRESTDLKTNISQFGLIKCV